MKNKILFISLFAAALIAPAVSNASTLVAAQLDGSVMFATSTGGNQDISTVSDFFQATGVYTSAYGQVALEVSSSSDLTGNGSGDCVNIFDETTFSNNFGQHCFTLAEFQSSTNPSYGVPTVITFTWGGNGVTVAGHAWHFLWSSVQHDTSTPQGILGNSTGTAPAFLICSDSSCGAAVVPPPATSCGSIINPSLLVPSSSITNDFTTWRIGFNSTPLEEGCTYQTSIIYQPEIGSITGGNDSVSTAVDPSTQNSFVSFVKSRNLWNFYNATTTTIDYTIQVRNLTPSDPQYGYVVGSAQGSFTLSFNATTTYNAPPGFDPSKQCGGVCGSGFGTLGGGTIGTASSTIALNGTACTPASDWTDIGGGLSYGFCSAFNYLFVANSSTQGIIQGDMTILETVPPFAWFFQVNAALDGVSAGPGGTATYYIGGNTTSTSFTPDNGLAFDIMTGINGATNSLTLIPADFTTNSFLSTTKGTALVDGYYNLILTFIICLIIIALYKIIL